MADTFEITVNETTTGSVADDLVGARTAAAAMYAHDQVVNGKDATGWSAATASRAEAACDAAAGLLESLGGGKDAKYRVTIHSGDDHLNIQAQRLS